MLTRSGGDGPSGAQPGHTTAQPEGPMTMPADRRPPGPGNSGARTAWVAGSVGPHLRIAAKSARMLLERHLTQAGASFGTWTVLAVLESAGPMIQRVLAASLGIEGPTLT